MMHNVNSVLSYEEYKAYCLSRFPALVDRSEAPMTAANTMVAEADETCPVTVRSVESRAVITPRSKGSR